MPQKRVQVKARYDEEEDQLQLRAEWEDELHREIINPSFSTKTKCVIGGIVLLGLVNLILNFLTLGPDVLHW
jgi:hypothetical protein